jgi:predicted DNA-binding protein (UPF0278 family)
MEFGIKNGNVSFFNKTTSEKLFESKILADSEIKSEIKESKKDLIPMRMTLADDFSIQMYITKETYEELQDFALRHNLKSK